LKQTLIPFLARLHHVFRIRFGDQDLGISLEKDEEALADIST